MAIDNRANNFILINNNLPDNILELITPLLHREVEFNLNDSCFNKLDEPRALNFFANTSSLISNIVPTYGTVTIINSERKSPVVGAVSYETSLNGAPFIAHADFTAYQTYMMSATDTTFIESRATLSSAAPSYSGPLNVSTEYY